MNTDEVIEALRSQADAARLPGMARVGIETSHALGVSVPAIRAIARRAGTDQRLAKDLWATEIHEARAVAALVIDPATITFRAMGTWAADLDSWDLTDILADTFARTPHADRAIRTWSRSSSSTQSRIASAARTARSGSSSCATGAPNSAITASPMNFSTVPP